ncbi:arsenate reductase (glutaredoxin) [Sphingomonas ursincola]|jgi:arsenate reductase|uniref:Arsenate reductase n=1 Tax=Sphingomonas ursincola TaxID=56361 RepID=A0A7V8U864_9SPHN|nr:arsenate reductase (glutaredoxin) [Sphingomonas ursincola]MBA1374107.1 arsenate reductase (glutaredoxin) [Sphingomonas ursincola]
MRFTIYHNPKCGTSRNVLAAIREAGHEPEVIEYLKTPPSRETLESLIARAGEGARGLLRAKEPLVKELGLDGADVTDAAIVDAMMAHPILINRPIVVTDSAVKLCRPSETVQELL